MLRLQEFKKYALISVAAILLAACASQREPAQKMLNEIDAAIAAASVDAAKYVPDQLNDVQTKFDDLKTAFTAQDYKAVLGRGPAILAQAQGLAAAAVAKKAELTKDLNEQWSALSAAVPSYLAATQARIDMLSQKKNKKLAAGIDLETAKSALNEATSLWSKAQGAFGNGNLDEAVSAAKDAKSKLQALASSLKLDLPTT